MIGIILGTRPEIIKLFPFIDILKKKKLIFLLYIQVNTIPKI